MARHHQLNSMMLLPRQTWSRASPAPLHFLLFLLFYLGGAANILFFIVFLGNRFLAVHL